MSDVINPEHECPFDPDDYKGDQIIAPVGSFWWALVQLKLGNKARRSGWPKEEQLNFVPRRTVIEGNYDYLSHIDKRNIYGNWAPWQPTQEDLMACDWMFVESDDNMLVFDLKPDYRKYSARYGEEEKYQVWGYDSEYGGVGKPPIGTLKITKNKTVIEKFINFQVKESGKLEFCVTCSDANRQKMEELLKRNLRVTVDDITYNLGTFSSTQKLNYNFVAYIVRYGNDDAQKLATLLQQSADKALHFCFSWK
ncbi:DUF2829 domain-containing protein [Xenorhabdus sp. XENO-7]|uniref:DUF2829 domain-containing protein n=1 Tax=Xenorhabdus aichiensis TaxID=3025874 RepID=A0ABT5M867_9GAMM|nr:DUF2829 domain-containing protein [Xenorhabdus aichiensis]MDC9623899.1 DUF2829 domain-containing protein [Xenorhabdus aichiensis]